MHVRDQRPHDGERRRRIDAGALEVDRIEIHPDVRAIDARSRTSRQISGTSDAPSWFSNTNIMSGCAVRQPLQIVGDQCRAPPGRRTRAADVRKTAAACATPSRARSSTCRSTESNVRSIPRRAMEEVAPSARDDPDALSVRRDRRRSVVDRHASFDQVMQVEVEIGQAEPREHLQRRDQRLRLVRRRRRQNAAASHRLEGERLLVGGVDGFRHAPVLELRVAADVAQVRDLLAAIDVGLIRRERLLGLLRIRLLGEQVVLERVVDRVPRKRLRPRRAGPALRSGSACRGSRAS